MKELIENLVKAQSAMSHAKASEDNEYFKSKYVPYEKLMDYVKTHLNDNGIYIQQVCHESDGGVCVETVLHGHGGSLSSGKVFVQAEKQTPQGYGSALTYARRYSLSLATGSGADKDDDANSAEDEYKKPKTVAKKPASPKQPAKKPPQQKEELPLIAQGEHGLEGQLEKKLENTGEWDEQFCREVCDLVISFAEVTDTPEGVRDLHVANKAMFDKIKGLHPEVFENYKSQLTAIKASKEAAEGAE